MKSLLSLVIVMFLVIQSNAQADTVMLAHKQLKGVRKLEDGLSYMADKKYKPLPAGTYKVVDEFGRNVIFTLVGNGLMNGNVTFSGENRNSETRYEYDRGVLKTETLLQNDDTLLHRKLSTIVYKDKAGNYLITFTELKRNYRYHYFDSICTVFKNKRPVLKLRYRNDKLATYMNFEKDSFDRFDNSNMLEYRYGKGFREWYDGAGVLKKRTTYKDGIHEAWENGKLRERSVYAKAGDSVMVILYDEEGGVLSKKSEPVILTTITGDADEYEASMNEAAFLRYKKMYNPVKAKKK